MPVSADHHSQRERERNHSSSSRDTSFCAINSLNRPECDATGRHVVLLSGRHAVKECFCSSRWTLSLSLLLLPRLTPSSSTQLHKPIIVSDCISHNCPKVADFFQKAEWTTVMTPLLICHLRSAPERLCHGPPQRPQDRRETPTPAASLTRPLHEHRRGPGCAGHVPLPWQEEEQAEGGA